MKPTEAVQEQPPVPLPRALRRIALTWLLLVLLGALEFGASYLPLPRELRPLVMVPGILMIIAVGVFFMEVNKGPVIVRGFAVAALFWLFVLLALGSSDPMTRTDYRVPHAAAR